MKTRKTRERVEKFGIDFPPFEDAADNWFDIPHIGKSGRTEKAHAKINRQVTEARFAYWKRWIDWLIPPMALIVAAIALFKDIIIELLKKS